MAARETNRDLAFSRELRPILPIGRVVRADGVRLLAESWLAYCGPLGNRHQERKCKEGSAGASALARSSRR